MANRHRGEVEVDLGGKTYALRPTFQALAEIEDKTGTNLVTLARRFADGDIGVRDVAVVLWAGMGEGAPSLDDVGRLVVERGLDTLIGPAAGFVAAVFVGSSKGGAPAKNR